MSSMSPSYHLIYPSISMANILSLTDIYASPLFRRQNCRILNPSLFRSKQGMRLGVTA